MPEPDDWLADALDGMCRAAEPRIRPAGPHAVRETVRRRRKRRLRATVAAALAGLLIGAITVSAGRGGDVPLDRHTPIPQPSSVPSPEPSETSSPPVVAGGVTMRPSNSPKPASPRCRMLGEVKFLVQSGYTFTMGIKETNPPMCPDGRVPLFLAVYAVAPDGTHTLHRSERHDLTYTKPESTVLASGDIPWGPCIGWAYYIVDVDTPILNTIPKALNGMSLLSPPYALQKESWQAVYPSCSATPSP